MVLHMRRSLVCAELSAEYKLFRQKLFKVSRTLTRSVCVCMCVYLPSARAHTPKQRQTRARTKHGECCVVSVLLVFGGGSTIF